MGINYSSLPLSTINSSLRKTGFHYQFHSLQAHPSLVETEKISAFHKGSYLLNCCSHFWPDFMISEEAKANYIYPQGFLIMEALSSYYTNRSQLSSYELRFTLFGEGQLIYRGRKYSLKPGEGYWIDCREPHEYKTIGNDWTCTLFHFDGVPAKALFQNYASNGTVKFTTDTCPNFEMLQYQILSASKKAAPFYEQKLSCLFTILLTELLCSSASSLPDNFTSDVMEHLIHFLQEHYMEDLTLDILMHQFGISRTNLCRHFKNYTDFTVKQYIMTLRLNQAKKLLQFSDLSVSEISDAIGFHDCAHFVQVFKSTVGVTPLQYKKPGTIIR